MECAAFHFDTNVLPVNAQAGVKIHPTLLVSGQAPCEWQFEKGAALRNAP